MPLPSGPIALAAAESKSPSMPAASATFATDGAPANPPYGIDAFAVLTLITGTSVGLAFCMVAHAANSPLPMSIVDVVVGLSRCDPVNSFLPAMNADIWRAFVEAREAGLASEIGVSNFDTSLLDEVTTATGKRPAVNQGRFGALRRPDFFPPGYNQSS